MAEGNPQDKGGEGSPLCSLNEEPHEQPRKLSMDFKSEDEDGGEAGDPERTADPDPPACPRGRSPGTRDQAHSPWQQPPSDEDEKFSDAGAGGAGGKPVVSCMKSCGERGESKTTQTHASSPGASRAQSALFGGLSHGLSSPSRKQPPGDSFSAGDGGDVPATGRYSCAPSGVDMSPDSRSPACVPKQEAHPGPQGSPATATLAAAETARTGQQGADGLEETLPCQGLRGSRAFQKPTDPRGAQLPGDKPYTCELCGKAYSHRGTLQQHRRLHTGERPYRCSFCSKAYTWASDHRKHLRTHTGEKPYPCPECGKAFVRSSDLRKHQRNMHSRDRPFPCPECAQTFNKPRSLLRHRRAHLGQRPFRCAACGREFAAASRMAEHQRVHSGERPFRCGTCGKSFSKSSNLAEHQTLHSGQRPFKCVDCGVAFAQPSRLARHQRIHTGERPFPCAQCGQAFARSSTLKRHQQTHSGEKGFLCAQCGRAFRIASELAQHIRGHNGERPYRCGDCGQAFTRSNHLRRHRAKHGAGAGRKEEPIPSCDE